MPDGATADERDMGTGWVFTPPDSKTLLQAMDNALTTYYDFPDSWQVRVASRPLMRAAGLQLELCHSSLVLMALETCLEPSRLVAWRELRCFGTAVFRHCSVPMFTTPDL